MEIPVPVCSGGTDMKKDEGFSVEVESRYEGWWRYNVTILCGCFDADGNRIGFASAESVVAPVGSDLSAPPEGAAAERRIGIRSIACDHIVMYVYIVPHTLPETRLSTCVCASVTGAFRSATCITESTSGRARRSKSNSATTGSRFGRRVHRPRRYATGPSNDGPVGVYLRSIR